VPADGELVSAAGSFDESLLSGESAGRRRSAGETVLGGSLNAGHAPVDIRVTRIGSDSYIERIGSLLHRAMAEKPAFLELADRWASRFVAAVLAATAVAGAIWLELAPERALEVVLAMLVATCPCALSLAAPTAFAVALGRLARRGLLCRSARVLERLGQVDTWLFDKTGTLTEGRMRIAGIEPRADLDETALLAVAAALEGGIEHPIARAIRAAADLPGAADVPIAANVPAAADIEYLPGFGVSGTIAGRRYRLGAARFVGIGTAAADPGQNVYLADDSRVLGRIELADTLRPHAREALDALVADGCSVALVSGDAAAPVSAAAHALGVGEYADSQSPDEKLAGLERRQRGGEVVAAVGDGINDAPLLARADVSVAMMAGSQLAQASADIVFTGNDLRVLAELPRWAAATGRIVRQNLGWAVLYNLAALPLAASGLLAPWMAALGMSLSSLVVVGNALRLNRVLAARRSAVVVDAGQGWPLGEQPSA
jgi:Cu2+-exporting ATPase